MTVPYPVSTGWRRLRLVRFVEQLYWNKIADRNRYDLSRALLDHFVDLAQALGSRPVVVFLPGQSDNQEDQARRHFLRAWGAARDVPYLDLTEAMRNAGVETVFIEGNWHWNAAGHRVAGEALHDFLRDEVRLER